MKIVDIQSGDHKKWVSRAKVIWLVLLAPMIFTTDSLASPFRYSRFAQSCVKLLRIEPPISVASSEHAPPALQIITPAQWQYSEKLIIPNTDRALSFSYDGETPWDELYTYIKNDPETLSAFHQIFEDYQFTKPELMKHLGLSEKQVDFFVLKKNNALSVQAQSSQKKWLVTDLSEHYFALMLEKKKEHFFRRFFSFLKKSTRQLSRDQVARISFLLETLVNKSGINAVGTQDHGFVELAHRSFDYSPTLFENTVRQLDQSFSKSTIHLHLGIPNTVSEVETIAIARAVEAKIIFSLVTIPISQTLPYYEFSSLYSVKKVMRQIKIRGIFRIGFGGVIRLGLNEFTSTSSHNLEVRQYQKIENGLDLIRFGSSLALNSKRLYTVDMLNPLKIEDPYTSNLNGALQYMGFLFKNKAHLTQLGGVLLSFSKQIENAKTVTPEMRVQIKRFIEKNNLLAVIDDLSLYMDVNSI